MIVAVVPAAGRSTRMGRPKLALRIGGRTVLERVIGALRAGGADHVVAVIGPDGGDLVGPATGAGAEVCQLDAATANMRATVEHGLRWLENRYQPTATDAFLLTPADYPLLQAKVIRGLCHAFRENSSQSIVVPVHAGERGHPVLLGWRHLSGIRAMPAAQGINAYIRERGDETIELAMAEPGVLFDLDVPEDYERLLQPRQVGEQ